MTRSYFNNVTHRSSISTLLITGCCTVIELVSRVLFIGAINIAQYS